MDFCVSEKTSRAKECYLCSGTEFHKRPGSVRDNPDLEILECASCGLVCLSSFDHIKIEIEDNGIGIDPKYHDQIFEMFKRLHTKEKYSGSGIGLSICKRIIESSGGEIGIYSNDHGGSTFWFTILKQPTLN